MTLSSFKGLLNCLNENVFLVLILSLTISFCRHTIFFLSEFWFCRPICVPSQAHVRTSNIFRSLPPEEQSKHFQKQNPRKNRTMQTIVYVCFLWHTNVSFGMKSREIYSQEKRQWKRFFQIWRKSEYNWGNHFFRIAENILWYFFACVPNISSYIIHLNPIQVSWKLLNQKFFFPFCWWLVSEQMGSVYFLWDSSYCAKSCLHLTQISTLIGSLNKTSRTDLLGDSSSESKIQRHGKFSHML